MEARGTLPAMPFLSNLTLPRPLGMLRYLAARLMPWRRSFRASAQSNLVFNVTAGDVIGRYIAKYGVHEPLLTRWIGDFLAAAPRGIVVDVGANLGWHTLHAARHGNVESVMAFEPDAFNAWLLERNLAENGIDNVIVDTRAVGAAPSIARLYRYKSTNYGRHSLATDHGFGSRNVLVTDLDGALSAAGFGSRAISLIKIDVEGYEPAVIAGAKETLKRAAALIVEYSPDASTAAGLSAAGLLADLQAVGFAAYVLLSTGGVAPVRNEELGEFSGTVDVIFVKAEPLAELSKGVNERPRGSLTVKEMADRNGRVKKPI
jgi:FkbM family methyltransferase